MSIFALGVGTAKSDDWLFVAVVLTVAYLLVYPLYLLLLRFQHARRIKSQLVTSAYKLPAPMTPAELAHIFSTKAGADQMYATLLDLANRSILILNKRSNRITVELGPRLPDGLSPPEKLLVEQVAGRGGPVPIRNVIEGLSVYEAAKEQRITGRRDYVFWWLLREQLRERKIIKSHMSGLYARVLFDFAVVGSLVLALGSLGIYRFVQILMSGSIDVELLVKHELNALGIWLIMLPLIVTVGFCLLRMRGSLLGRHWLLTPKFRRYVNQLIAFKEFVRLTQKGKLRFESKELEKDTILGTRPYAIALGFVDEKLSGK